MLPLWEGLAASLLKEGLNASSLRRLVASFVECLDASSLRRLVASFEKV